MKTLILALLTIIGGFIFALTFYASLENNMLFIMLLAELVILTTIIKQINKEF